MCTAIIAAVFLACLCLVDARTTQDVHLLRRITQASRIPAASYCALRDFPPKGGYGASRMYCTWPVYDHYWMWRIIKVDGSSSGGSNSFNSGDNVYITINNPVPYKYCQLKSNVECGHQNGTAFTIEKASGTGSITLGRDDLVLRVRNGYCSLRGSGHSQQITCAANRTGATVFQVAASSFVQVQLQNKLSRSNCGGYFYGGLGAPATVGCSSGSGVFPGFSALLTVALQTPGTPAIEAGANVSFKVYDDWQTYHVVTWMEKNATVDFDLETTLGNAQWFRMERLTGPPAGDQLVNATQVALRSSRSSLYCGQKLANSTALTCDLPGPLTFLPDGYKYTFYIVGWICYSHPANIKLGVRPRAVTHSQRQRLQITAGRATQKTGNLIHKKGVWGG
ncbi:hypothetical protein VOLCADRAFT_95173 [Volvox carteri f. nagariensis]|uniref:Pherophorin domain-containing protein n=1 Tax=Volvox carteri f. nagariensis TaxID=3068 RepID=D8U6T2_VOLCA|nr:uncharacterized protein VOLCADRAFT_95173 [Volvox carteri f. nagariensis]EFJ44566.1 hypothetical protein VOLCADRAFT_95173 [Volvox carteri f. nagariensis]|eukprot:XP_002954416.1 hypothetical protein VOLCADRAFT_95173 [Volvox carteri f. nagariensis]